MLFPLGLGFWPKGRIPWATVLLVVVIVIVSKIEFGAVDRYNDAIQNASEELQIQSKWIHVLTRICELEKTFQDCKAVFSRYKVAGGRVTFTQIHPITKVPAKGAGNSPPKIPAKSTKTALTFKQMFSEQRSLSHFIAKYGNPDRLPQRYKTLPEAVDFLNARTELKMRMAKAAEDNHLLTRKSLSLEAVMKATGTHGSTMHLVGNMIFLIIFGSYVELAFGGPILILMFLLGSVIGLSAEVLTMPNDIALMGASAGVMAFVGAYLVQYWRMPMKFLFTIFPFYFRILYIATPIAVPVLFVLGDFIGVLARAQHLDSVAHVAHLSGFSVGALVSLTMVKLDGLPKPFEFNEELALFSRLRQTSDLFLKFQLYFEIVKWNPYNDAAALDVLAAVAKETTGGAEAVEKTLGRLSQQTIEEFAMSLNHMLRLKFANNPKAALRFLEALDFTPSGSLLARLPWQILVRWADLLVRNKKYELALRLYRHVLDMPNIKIDRSGLEKTCEHVEKALWQVSSKS